MNEKSQSEFGHIDVFADILMQCNTIMRVKEGMEVSLI